MTDTILIDMQISNALGSQRSQLAVGYFVWLLSFLLLAVGLFVSSRIVLRLRAVE